MPEPSGSAPNQDRQVDEDSTAELDRVVSVEVDGVTVHATVGPPPSLADRVYRYIDSLCELVDEPVFVKQSGQGGLAAELGVTSRAVNDAVRRLKSAGRLDVVRHRRGCSYRTIRDEHQPGLFGVAAIGPRANPVSKSPTIGTRSERDANVIGTNEIAVPPCPLCGAKATKNTMQETTWDELQYAAHPGRVYYCTGSGRCSRLWHTTEGGIYAPGQTQLDCEEATILMLKQLGKAIPGREANGTSDPKRGEGRTGYLESYRRSHGALPWETEEGKRFLDGYKSPGGVGDI